MQIYKINFKQTIKSYVGLTTFSAEERLREHLKLDKKSALVNAIKKYGKENIILTVLCECDDFELLCLAEQEAIDKYKTKFPNGYNLTDGGEGTIGLVYTKEQKEQNSERLRKYYSNPENRKKNSEAQKIAHGTKEARERHSRISTEYISVAGNKEKISELTKAAMNTPEMKTLMSNKTKDYFQRNPEAKQAAADRAKKYYADPENRRKQSERIRKYYADNPTVAKEVWAKRRLGKA